MPPKKKKKKKRCPQSRQKNLFYANFTHFPAFVTLPTTLLTDALQDVYPQSWKQTRMVLFFNKGDPEMLSNWRPLSMIDCDARLFTKVTDK